MVIETDGTIPPREALEHRSGIMLEQLHAMLGQQNGDDRRRVGAKREKMMKTRLGRERGRHD